MTAPHERLSIPADPARGAAGQITDPAQGQGEPAVVELHQIARRRARPADAAAVTVERPLKPLE